MDIAKWRDSLEPERDWSHTVTSECLSVSFHTNLVIQKSDEGVPTMIITFVLLKSPLLSHDPQTIIVSREHRFIRRSPSLPSILV